jgi:predicted DNA-binding transcriptional regulator YafY
LVFHFNIREKNLTNQTHRVLELLKRFNNNEKVCIAQLTNEFLWEEKSEKTIRRDLDAIKSIFPESFELIRGEKGCYKAITRQAFENFMKPNTLSLMVQTFSIAQQSNLFNNLDIDDIDRRIIESKIKDLKKVYEFKNKPLENKASDIKIFKKLESSIYHKKEIIIDYEVNGELEQFEIKPYKILFMSENFYLASEVMNQNFVFSVFRISKIKDVAYANKTFHHNLDIISFIQSMQTPLAKYTPNFRDNLMEVIIEVDSSKAEHFKAKKYMHSQTLVEEKDNGNIILKFTVTREVEMKDIVKRWLPYVHVISPKSLRDEIADDINQYLNK